MRADRLLSLLILLQTRGGMTAPELARDLEVSERTIYRDVNALSAAGVPIYGEPGPGGGYALLESYRTTLTGLNEGELRALFMLSIPEPLIKLGVSQDLRAAILKLTASAPAAWQQDAGRMRQRFCLDSTWWNQGTEPEPFLQTLYQAVLKDCRLALNYQLPSGGGVEQIVDALGLVAKAGVWYLVCAGEGATRVHRVADLRDARLLSESFQRPADFDLAAFWRSWCARHEQLRWLYPVTLRVDKRATWALARRLGTNIQDALARAAPPDAQGWITIEISFESLGAARDQILGLGRAVEVVEPWALRRSVIDYAEQIVALYTSR